MSTKSLIDIVGTESAAAPVEHIDADELRDEIGKSLLLQGFIFENGRLIAPPLPGKDAVRELHAQAVAHKRGLAARSLKRRETKLLTRFADGQSLRPEKIRPLLVEVMPDSDDELLFRYASLHWSIPVSSGYGRRLRFLVIDEENEKLIGLIGLGDPVFGLAARDNWIGWSFEERKKRLRHVMDAFVLGAVPPYSYLLAGKLVAMLAASDEVRQAFARKYGQSTSVIKNNSETCELLLLTTTSALGRSSIYQRIKVGDRKLYIRVGYTKGSGEFQFFNGTYDLMFEYARLHVLPTAKQSAWGTGFRNRREVVRKCLQSLGLSTDWNYHGVQREVFVVPLASNTQEVLTGPEARPIFPDSSVNYLSEAFKDRWLLRRAATDYRYREFQIESLRLWP
jgi:hypothetical protein